MITTIDSNEIDFGHSDCLYMRQLPGDAMNTRVSSKFPIFSTEKVETMLLPSDANPTRILPV